MTPTPSPSDEDDDEDGGGSDDRQAKQSSKRSFCFVGVGLFEPREHAIEIHLVHLLHHCHQVLLASKLLHHTRVHAALRMHTHARAESESAFSD